MSISQLPSPILVTTPLGEASIHFVFDGGDEVYWGCFQRETCELWWWRGQFIRYAIHLSEGYVKQSPIHEEPDMGTAMAPHRKRYAQPR